MATASPNRYPAALIVLHWATLALVILAFLTHEDIDEALELWQAGRVALPEPLALTHFGAGTLVLALTVLRLGLRALLPAPAAHPGQSAAMDRAARAVHLALYALLLALPATGLAMVLGAGGELDDLHEGLFNVLLALVGLHAAAALVHQMVLRDGTLTRIWPSRRG